MNEQNPMGREATRNKLTRDILQQFVAWLNVQKSSNMRIIAHPEPPDALVQSSRGVFWIEHADVPRNGDQAHELFSQLTPGESRHKHTGLTINIYDTLPDSAITTLHKKLHKRSYNSVYNQHGPGLLLLNEMDPLFDQRTLNSIFERVQAYLKHDPKGGRGYFSKVYLRYWVNEQLRYSYIQLAEFAEQQSND